MVKVIQCGMADPWPISDTPATLPVITTITQHFDSIAKILKLWQYDQICGLSLWLENATPLFDSHFSSFQLLF